MSRSKLRRLGPGSWFVPGQNTLHLARAFYNQRPNRWEGVLSYLDGIVVF